MGTAGRYSIVLFRDGGEGSGIEAVLDSDDLVDTARGLHQRAIMKLPGRLVMLCDGAHVLVRSDRPVDGHACPNCGGVFAAPLGERPKPRADRPPRRRSPPLAPKNSYHR
jgi:hypothetical protein